MTYRMGTMSKYVRGSQLASTCRGPGNCITIAAIQSSPSLHLASHLKEIVICAQDDSQSISEGPIGFAQGTEEMFSKKVRIVLHP